MKNVLLTTTALVAFAGTAFAAAHEGGPTITFSGDAEVKYNDAIDAIALADGDPEYGIFSAEANLDIAASIALNNGITAGATYGISLGDGTGISGDALPVVFLESAYGKLSAGNGDAIGPASDHFSDTSGVSGFADGAYDADTDLAVRADVSFSGIDFSVSTSDLTDGATIPEDTRFGASGAFGSFDFGLGYAMDVDGLGTTEMGVNVGTSFSGFDVDFSYFDSDASGADYGIEVGYAISSSITVGAYYASVNDAADTEFGVSVGYASGPLGVDLSYDDGSSAAQEITLDVSYEVMADLTVFAGYKSINPAPVAPDADGGYVGVEYDLGNGAKAWASYSEYDEAGGPEFDDGITVGVSVEF